jgi:hypothetical protein
VNTKSRDTYTKQRKKKRKTLGKKYREGKTGQFGVYEKKNEDKRWARINERNGINEGYTDRMKENRTFHFRT